MGKAQKHLVVRQHISCQRIVQLQESRKEKDESEQKSKWKRIKKGREPEKKKLEE